MESFKAQGKKKKKWRRNNTVLLFYSVWMGQPSGSWCIYNHLLSKRERQRKRKRGKNKAYSYYEYVNLFAFLLYLVCPSLFGKWWVFILKPYAMLDIFTLDLFFIAIDPNTESVEDLMQRFQDSFRVPNTPTDMSNYQHVMHSSLTSCRRVPSHTRGRAKSHS